jgi:hypothetical protein
MTQTETSDQARAVPALTNDNLRIVVEHTVGPLRGIHSIVCLKRDAPDPLPEIVEPTETRQHVPVSLVAVKRSYVLYREIYKPERMLGRAQPDAPFDSRQV